MKCHRHPKYTGKRKPRTDCKTCLDIFHGVVYIFRTVSTLYAPREAWRPVNLANIGRETVPLDEEWPNNEKMNEIHTRLARGQLQALIVKVYKDGSLKAEIDDGNKVAHGDEPHEFLFGGPCDGLKVQKVNGDKTYAGRFGDGIVNIYVRQKDGKLHYLKSVKAHRLAAENESGPIPELDEE